MKTTESREVDLEEVAVGNFYQRAPLQQAISAT